VIVDVIGAVPLLVAVKAAMSPDPLEANPMAVLEFDQTNVLPDGVLVKFVPITILLLQIVILDGTETVGLGVTVIKYVEGTPLQLPKLGVTVIVAVIAVVPELVAINDVMFPVPVADKPILVFVFVQL